MNGTTHTQRKPFKVLSQYLPTSNSDHEYWWRLTGKHVAALLEAAGYPIEEQYAALLFHFHWTVSETFYFLHGGRDGPVMKRP
jgi:hypothetical protein